MADESDKKRLVRFDFPRGASDESIARALNEYRRRLLHEAAEQKQAAERGAGEATPETPAKTATGQADGRHQGGQGQTPHE